MEPMESIPRTDAGLDQPRALPLACCPAHGMAALVVITGGHENGLRCNVSTCCAAFAERIVGSVEA